MWREKFGASRAFRLRERGACQGRDVSLQLYFKFSLVLQGLGEDRDYNNYATIKSLPNIIARTDPQTCCMAKIPSLINCQIPIRTTDNGE